VRLLASHGIGGFLALWPKSWLVLAIIALPVVVIVDLLRRRPGRIPRHLLATAVAGVFVGLSAIPIAVWDEHEAALPADERHGACIGCGMLVYVGGAAGFGAGYLVNRALRPERERLAALPPPPE
jgi:hypothetical protein